MVIADTVSLYKSLINQDSDSDDTDKQPSVRTVIPQVLCSETQTITECQSLHRLVEALKFYDQNGRDDDKVMEYFHRYDHLLNDYTHILSVHFGHEKDIDDMVGALMYSKVRQSLKCDLKTCPYYYSRDQPSSEPDDPVVDNKASKQSNEVVEMDVISDETSHRVLFYQKMMAAIHCYLLHPFYTEFKMIRPGDYMSHQGDDTGAALSNLANLWEDNELSRLKQMYLAIIRTSDAHKMIDALHKKQPTRFNKFMIGTYRYTSPNSPCTRCTDVSSRWSLCMNCNHIFPLFFRWEFSV